MTTILVTHDQVEDFELADRIGVIEKGSLMEVGNPEDLYYRPKSEFVATFIRGGNVLVGHFVKGQIQMGSISFPFPESATPHEEGSPVRILFRPETVLLQKQVGSFDRDKKLFVQGQLVERIFAGAHQRFRIEVENLQGTLSAGTVPVYGKQLTRIEAIQPNLPGEDQFDAGQPVWIGLKEYHVL